MYGYGYFLKISHQPIKKNKLKGMTKRSRPSNHKKRNKLLHNKKRKKLFLPQERRRKKFNPQTNCRRRRAKNEFD